MSRQPEPRIERNQVREPIKIEFEIPYPTPPGVEGLMLTYLVFERMVPEERLATVNWLIDYYSLPVRGGQS